MPVSNVFGSILVPSTLEDATATMLQTWFPTYLREIESQLGLAPDSLIPPKKYTNRNKFDSLRGEDLPRCVVMSPGLASSPNKDGSGMYRASWRIGVGVAIAADTDEIANDQVKIYGAAVRAIVLQKGGKNGLGDVNWVDENYDDIPISDQLQQYRAASIWFTADINNVVTRKPGPEIADADPYSYGIVESVDVLVTKE